MQLGCSNVVVNKLEDALLHGAHPRAFIVEDDQFFANKVFIMAGIF